MAVFIGERCEHIMLMHVVYDQHCDYIMVTSYRPVAILGRSVVQGWWHSGVLGSCLSTPLPIQMELCVWECVMYVCVWVCVYVCVCVALLYPTCTIEKQTMTYLTDCHNMCKCEKLPFCTLLNYVQYLVCKCYLILSLQLFWSLWHKTKQKLFILTSWGSLHLVMLQAMAVGAWEWGYIGRHEKQGRGEGGGGRCTYLLLVRSDG